jgi:hypothetical protein
MQDTENAVPTTSKRLPWNKGKLTGAKPPLRPKHVWSIRTKLQVEGRTRDLAMFNLAIAASCVAAMSLPSRSRMLHRAGIQSIGRRCGRRRPGSPSGLN